MSRKFYAASNSYGTSCTYDSPGWIVHVFLSKLERDVWVNEYPCLNRNISREVVTRNQADKIYKPRDFEVDYRIYHENGVLLMDTGDGNYAPLVGGEGEVLCDA